MTLGPLHPWETPETGGPAVFAAGLRAGIPVLETERLRLRAPMMEDFVPFAEISMSDHARYMGGPLTRSETFLDFAQCISSWLLNGYGMFTVEAEGEVVGFATLVRGCDDDEDRESGDLEPELGYFFLPQYCGKGYATEAARAVRDWGIETLNVGSMVSYIDRHNTPSVNVAEKLNAWRDTPHPDFPEDHVYRHWPRRALDG